MARAFERYLLVALTCYILWMSLQAKECKVMHGEEVTLGTGNGRFTGSCWCNAGDKYCQCTPQLCINAIIENPEERYLIVERGAEPPGLASMGGFVSVGESAEQATVRELHEETHMKVDEARLRLVAFYSKPDDDARRHGACAWYYIRVTAEEAALATGGDDAKGVRWMSGDQVIAACQDGQFPFNSHCSSFSKFQKERAAMGL